MSSLLASCQTVLFGRRALELIRFLRIGLFRNCWIQKTVTTINASFHRYGPKRAGLLDLLDFLRISRDKEKKKLTDTGLLEIPWILDVKDFRTDIGLKRLI
jgi:hypothetical protein